MSDHWKDRPEARCSATNCSRGDLASWNPTVGGITFTSIPKVGGLWSGQTGTVCEPSDLRDEQRQRPYSIKGRGRYSGDSRCNSRSQECRTIGRPAGKCDHDSEPTRTEMEGAVQAVVSNRQWHRPSNIRYQLCFLFLPHQLCCLPLSGLRHIISHLPLLFLRSTTPQRAHAPLSRNMDHCFSSIPLSTPTTPTSKYSTCSSQISSSHSRDTHSLVMQHAGECKILQ